MSDGVPTCKKPECGNCGVTIGRVFRSCPVCNETHLHPGCISPFIKKKESPDCCKNTFSSHSAPIHDFSAGPRKRKNNDCNSELNCSSKKLCATSNTPDTNSPSTSLEIDANFTGSLPSTNNTNMDEHTNSNLSPLPPIQGVSNEFLNSDMGIFLTAIRTENRTGFNSAIQANASTRRDVDAVIHRQNIFESKFVEQTCYQSSSLPAEISISGFPSTITDDPHTIVLKVLTAIGLPNPQNEIIDVRVNKSTIETPTNVSQSSDNAIITESASIPTINNLNTTNLPRNVLFVTLSSSIIRAVVMRKKQAKYHELKRSLCSTDFYPTAPKTNIFINEIHPPQVFNLLKLVRKAAKRNGFLNPYVRGTIILVKRTKESQPIAILTEEDISKLTKVND